MSENSKWGTPDFNPSGIMAEAHVVAEQAQAETRAVFRQELEAAIARASAEPGGGTYITDGPRLAVQGSLPMPPGLIGDVARYIYKQAPLPVPEVAIVGALGLMAGICGKVWHIPSSGLNLYVVLVARSAIGKEAMHSGIAKIIAAVGAKCPNAGNFVDFDDFVSGPALVKTCLGKPSFVNVAGEIGHKFLAMAENRDMAMRSLRKQLTIMYSKSGPTDILGGIAYSNRESNVASARGIAFSMIGETTPGTFYESITDAMMSDGFMSRFCVIEYGGDRPDWNSALEQHPSSALVDHIARIVAHADLAIAGDKFQEVAFSAGASAVLDAFRTECHHAIIAAGDDENVRQLWNRAHLKALRVAALLAVGDQYLNPIVTEEQAAWAVMLIRHGNAAFDRRIRQGDVGEGTDGGREKKILELCRDFILLPPENIPLWLRKSAKMLEVGIVPRKYLQQRTRRLTAFGKHKLGHTSALNMAIKTAITNGSLMEVRKNALVEQYGFHGQAYRVITLD